MNLWFQIFISIIGSITAVIVIEAVLRIRRNSVAYLIARFAHYVFISVRRKKYILIWNDDDVAVNERIIGNIKMYFPAAIIKSLLSPRDLLKFSTSRHATAVVVLIDSDVTKLSENPKIKEIIQDWLIKFLAGGGGLVGTHDLIYKRVRNRKLEKAFGCQLDDFRRAEKVQYVKNPNLLSDRMVQGLPDTFELDDGELIWGDWADDVVIIFHTTGDHPKPLVIKREYSNGKIVWINSGDKKDYISNSILLPDVNFIKLLTNSIKEVLYNNMIDREKKLIIAHRGKVAADKQGNTYQSFDKAIEYGADMIEFDVRRTKDGSLIVCHDEKINDLDISESSFEEIKNAVSEDIPSLEEVVIHTRNRVKLDVEIKETGYETDVVEVLLKYLKEDDFIITTFNDSSVKDIKDRYPGVKVGLLLGRPNPENLIKTRISELFPFKRAQKIDPDFLAPNWQLLKFAFLKRACKHNLPVYVWTVNNPKLIDKFLVDEKIKAIITDELETAIQKREEKF